MKKGIDVSVHNGDIDWKSVSEDGIGFAIIRASYGDGSSDFINSGIDANFEANYRGAREAGLKVGAYHYLYARNLEEAEREADFFLSRLDGRIFDFPLVLDFEDSDAQGGLSSELRTDMAVAFLERLEEKGYYASIYSSKYWLENYFEEDRLKDYDKWVAEWSYQISYKGEAGLWQYTSTGSVAGIAGYVDMNYVFKDYPAIMESSGLNGYKKKATGQAPLDYGLVVYTREPDKAAAELLATRLDLSLLFARTSDDLSSLRAFYHVGKASFESSKMKEIYGKDRFETLKEVIKFLETKC